MREMILEQSALACKTMVGIFVVTTMFGVGITLTLRGIARSLSGAYLMRSFVACFALLPLLAILIIKLVEPNQAVAIALLLVAALPGAPIVGKIVSLSRGEVARGVSLVIVLMLASMALAPALVPLLVHGVAVSALDVARSLVPSVLLPLLAGLILRARFPGAAHRMAPIMACLSSAVGLLVLAVVPIAYSDQLKSLLEARTVGAFVLFLGPAIAIGWLTGGHDRSGRQVLAIVCGQGNQATAFLVAMQSFTDPQIPVAVIGIMLTSVGMLLPVALGFATCRVADRSRWART